MKKFNNSDQEDNKYYGVFQAMEDRTIDWISNLGRGLAEKRMFVQNWLLDRSAVSFTDKNDYLRPFTSTDTMLKVTTRNGKEFGIGLSQATDSLTQFVSRLGEDARSEEIFNYYDINIPEARRIYNKNVTKSLQNDFSYTLRSLEGDPTSTFLSKSYNFLSRRILEKGKFFSDHRVALEHNVNADGTGYTKMSIHKYLDDNGIFREKVDFKFLPIHKVIDDGRYTSDADFDLDNSKFVLEIHYLDKDSAKRLLRQFASVKTVEEGTSIQNTTTEFEDEFNSLWTKYGEEEYRSIRIVEAYWRDYNTDYSTDFTWMRTFFTIKEGSLFEIDTHESPFAYGMPYVKHQHEITTGTPFGYTPTTNNIDIDNARNTIMSGLFHKARRNSYEKIFHSSRLKNVKDDEGNYWLPYRDQIFHLSNMLYAGQSIKNFIQAQEPQPIDTQPLNLINSVQQEIARNFDVPNVNPNRTSRGSLAIFYDQANEIFQPMLISDAYYLGKLGQKIYEHIANYDEVEIEDLKRQFAYRQFIDGIDLRLFVDAMKEFPKDPIDLGLTVKLESQENAIKNKSLDLLLPILDRFGPQVLADENVVSLFGLREAGFELPRDKEKQIIYKDIFLIKKGEINSLNVTNYVLNSTQEIEALNQETGQTQKVGITEWDITDHKFAMDVVAEYLNVNKVEIRNWTREKADTLLTYFNLHREGAAAQQQKALAEQQAQAQAQQAPQAQQQAPEQAPQQEQAPQGPSEQEIMQLLQDEIQQQS